MKSYKESFLSEEKIKNGLILKLEKHDITDIKNLTERYKVQCKYKPE